MNLPILMYHKIEDSEPGNDLAVPARAFAAQMRCLKQKGYTSISLKQLARSRGDRRQLPKRPVVITFDDAYQSVFESAQPVLAELGFQATVFAVPEALGKSNIWDQGKNVRLSACMDQAALRQLAGEGWEIGSHGLRHLNLPALTDAELDRELGESKAVLEQSMGQDVESFCYPFGAWDKRVRDAAARAGYAAACAISPGTRSVTADLLALRRVYVKPSDSMAAFRRKISGWYLAYRAWRKR